MARFFVFFCLLGLLCCSCASYKKNIMFKPTEGYQPEIFKKEAQSIEKDYVIQKNDLLKLEVYSNKGERFIDPNPDISNTGNTGKPQQINQVTYLVDHNGIVKLPLIGEIKLVGLTLRQAEEIAQKEYSKSFTDSYVQLAFANKRVVVLGAPGGQVIPLTNQNVALAEVLALAKGVNNDAKANNIKLIRGSHIYQIDFSTIKGFSEGNMIIEAGDIVYVEPIRRPFTEGLKDNYVLVSLFISILTVVLINNVKL
jgi:polysaccharide biosynthesis/export protein